MTFTTPDGTYGIRMKPNRMMKWFMARQVRAIRRGRPRMMGLPALVLITRGRKSGSTYETPIAYWAEPTGSWLVCASAAGARRNPAWYRNLAASPDTSAVVIAGVQIPVVAEELHGAERAAAWAHIVHTAPRFQEYTKKTDRELPVIRLTTRTA